MSRKTAIRGEMTKRHEAMLNIVIPEGEADPKCRPEMINTSKTLDYSQTGLKEHGYFLSGTALYYRLISANMRHKRCQKTFQCRNMLVTK